MHRRELGVWVAAAVGLVCGVVVAGAAVVYIHRAHGERAAAERLRSAEIELAGAEIDLTDRERELDRSGLAKTVTWGLRTDRYRHDAKWRELSDRVFRLKVEIQELLVRNPGLRRYRLPD